MSVDKLNLFACTNLSRDCRSVRWKRMFGCAATFVLASVELASPRRRTSCAPNSHLTLFLADATTKNLYLKTNTKIPVLRNELERHKDTARNP